MLRSSSQGNPTVLFERHGRHEFREALDQPLRVRPVEFLKHQVMRVFVEEYDVWRKPGSAGRSRDESDRTGCSTFVKPGDRTAPVIRKPLNGHHCVADEDGQPIPVADGIVLHVTRMADGLIELFELLRVGAKFFGSLVRVNNEMLAAGFMPCGGRRRGIGKCYGAQNLHTRTHAVAPPRARADPA